MGITHRNPTIVYLTLLLYISYGFPLFCEAADTITQGELLRDGETIVSSRQIFVLGFFSPVNSTSRYVGIWYSKVSVQTVVWVANRDSPVSGEDGALTIGDDGNLSVLDGNGTSVWSSNASVLSQNSTAMLMDTGNLILSGNESIGDTNNALWQSFENPTDTFLPGMIVHVDASIDQNHIFKSWKSLSNPSTGNYSMGIDPRGSPQIVIWEGSNRLWRSGHWNGLIFLGVPITRSFYSNGFKFSNDGDGEMYFTYTPSSSNETVRFQLWWDGHVEQLIWNETSDWGVLQLHPANQCEGYNKCGSFGKCSGTDSPTCDCVEGFEPKNSDQWHVADWSGGCLRRTPLQCGSNGSSDGFLAVEGVKLPDYADRLVAESTEACEEKCLKNCSCNGYAFVVGIQCMMWSVDLVDVEHLAEGGNTLYVRLADSELGGKSRLSTAQTISISVAGTIVLGVFVWVLWRFRKKLKEFSNSQRNNNELPIFQVSESRQFSTDFSGPDGLAIEGKQELPLFDFNCIAAATNDFSNKNKLGQGGFGPVYKGMLPRGQEIAVKRLSRSSGQGLEEFKNEIILIAKLQHRNLVRLLGCCIQGEERLLVYEYMPNNSLDSFIFDPAKQAQLDWSQRFRIIEGIARGLLYLHRDSRLRIIHRDLKASNILLDEEMNSKISDFGMARIFGGNQNEANTNRVVGTYGYMSPEYAMEGLFSVKSDVYSFGVLLLEIVSGQRNNGFRSPGCSNLIRYAWQQWNDNKAMELIDPCISDSCSRNEVLRCIHVGMLCVQGSAVHRPTMSSVVLMLESEDATLPVPRQPTFSSMSSNAEMILRDMSIEGDDNSFAADVEVSEVIGR